MNRLFIGVPYCYHGQVDDFLFFDCSSPFCFLSIEFYCTFSISYKILPYYVYYYCIQIRSGLALLLFILSFPRDQ